MAFNAMYIKKSGDQSQPFAYAGSDETGQLAVEMPDGGSGRVASLKANSFTVRRKADGATAYADVMSAGNVKLEVYVTDSRVAFRCKKYKKGRAWYGTGAGALVAGIAMLLSAIIAAVSRSGKLLLGQVRYEWISQIQYSRKVSWKTANSVRLCYTDTEKNSWIIGLTFKKDVDTAALANDILHRACRYRLATQEEKSETALAFFNQNAQSGVIPPSPNPKNYASVTFPTYYTAPGGEAKRPAVIGAPAAAPIAAPVSPPVAPVTPPIAPPAAPPAPVTPPPQPGKPKFCGKCGSPFREFDTVCWNCGANRES